jgi:ADP-heptose:LPS heptosyltransferase
MGIPLVAASGWLRRRRAMPDPATVRRVGLLTSTTMGDTLLASGPIRDLRQIWPAAEFIFFAGRENRSAAELLPEIDDIVDFQLTRPWTAARAMRRSEVDALVDFTPWQRVTALASSHSGAKFVAGFRRAGQHRHAGYDLAVEHRGDRHELENFRALVDGLAAAAVARGDLPRADSGAAEHAEPALRNDVWSTSLDEKWRGAVVFHCWASGNLAELREWPADRWVELAQRLATSPKRRVVLTGGATDTARSTALAATMRQAGLDAEVFVAADGLRSVAALMRAAEILVSVNTGPMHLAAIAGAPTVGLSGPTNDARWGPRGTSAVGVQAPGADCGYLDLGWEWERDPNHGKTNVASCMERISVDEVMAAAARAKSLAKGAAVGAH